MALRLSNQDLDACSRCMLELHEGSPAGEFPQRVLSLLSGVVPVEYASYNEFNPRQKQFDVRCFPERPEVQRLVPELAATIPTHPLFDHFRKGEPLPKKVSDLASGRQFRETAVYHEYYRHLGVENQMVFSLKGTGKTVVGLALNRKAQDFTERDRSVLAFLSPHVTQAFHQNRIAAETAVNLEAIGAGLGEINRALILAEPDGRICWWSQSAQAWLAELFPAECAGSPRLPDCLRRRLGEFARPGKDAGRSHLQFQFAASSGDRLVVYCGRAGADLFLLAMTRERARIEKATASALGLTPREAEILFWISEAKANPEMAAILGISPRTVHKHVEHLFAKLGVASRFEAQRLGWELRRL